VVQEQSTVLKLLRLRMDRLERSIADCEELLASMQTTKHPSADRSKYLLKARLATVRKELKDIIGGEEGDQAG